MRGFQTLTRVEEAQQRFFASIRIPPLEPETVPLADALGRILAEDIRASVDVPGFDRAAMDGYAIVAEDTFGASQTNPLILKVIGAVEMGEQPKLQVQRGIATAIPTGAPMPQGANAVVMLEYTKKVGDDQIEVYASVPVRENVSAAGEDVKKGDVILRRGTRLRPQDLGILASIGVVEVKVQRPLVVGVLSTGNELVPPGQVPKAGQVVDVNQVVISSFAREMGCETINLGVARDREEEIWSRLEEGLKRCDLVLVSGGTSVGAADLVPIVINKIGKPGVIVHGVSMRPAYPTGLACIDGKPIILLSGYPVAAMIGFDVFARPVIHRMQGTKEEPAPTVRGRLLRRIPSPGGMRTFARVLVKRVNGELVVEPIRISGSGVVTTMVRANGMVVIPESIDGYEADEAVEVTLFRPVEEA